MMQPARRSLLGAVPAWVWLGLVIVGLPLAVAAATSRGMLGLAALAAIAVAGVVVTMAHPMPFLLLYVALIPLETVLVVGEAGTITRLVGIVFFGGYLLRRFGKVHLGAMPLAGWAFMGWAALSIAWALDPSLALTQVLTLAQLFTMTIAVADLVADDPRSLRPILLVYAASATITSGIAIVGFAAGGSFLGRAEAFAAQDPAHFAAILVPAFFIAVFELAQRRGGIRAMVALVVVAAGIVLSGTRSAWLAIGVSFVAGVLPRLGRRTVVPVVLLGVCGIALMAIPEIGSYVLGRAGSALDTGGAGRIDIWSIGLSIFANHPIIGVGYDNFPVAFTPEVIRDTAIPGLNTAAIVPGLAPHSSAISTLTELGLVGAALLLAFLATVVFRRGWGEYAPAIQAIVIALLVQSLFLDVFNRKALWIFFALALGLAWRAVMERRAEQRAAVPTRDGQVESMRRTWVPGR